MESEKYHLLDDSETLDEDVPAIGVRNEAISRRPRVPTMILTGMLAVSLVLNIILTIEVPRLSVNKTNDSSEISRWAKLERNVPKPIYSSTEYGPAIGTDEERDRLWNALDISPGAIRLSDEFAHENGLPLSQRFPWDQSQGVYLLGAYHQLHCLKRMYRWTSQIQRGEKPDRPYSHVLHCLDTLLQDVYCHADDTPWYQLPPEPYRQKYAEFQTRQCRSFDKLVEWSKKHDACYKYDNVTDVFGNEVSNQFEHYRYCEEGSPFIPTMESYFDAVGVIETVPSE